MPIRHLKKLPLFTGIVSEEDAQAIMWHNCKDRLGYKFLNKTIPFTSALKFLTRSNVFSATTNRKVTQKNL